MKKICNEYYEHVDIKILDNMYMFESENLK